MKYLMLLALALVALTASAQSNTSCTGGTAAKPCFQITVTNASMSATVTTNSSGVQISGPGTLTVWKCVGNASTCTAASLGGSPWVAQTAISQTSATGVFADWSIAYGQTLNYAATNSWTGGGTSGYSGVLTFQMPQAPAQAPTAPSTPTGVLVAN